MFQFLRPIFERCKDLQIKGIKTSAHTDDQSQLTLCLAGVDVQVGPERKMMTCRAMVLCVTVDLPAKTKLLNFTQFNGKFGCSACKHEGEQVAVGHGTTHAYPHSNPSAAPRNHAASYKDGKKAGTDEVVATYIADN